MSKAHKTAIGLDIGTSRIVSAMQSDGQEQFRAQLNAFINLPYSKITENVFRKESVPYFSEGGELYVYGNEAEKFAALFRCDVRRPMTRGLLNPDESYSLPVIRQITARALEGHGSNALVCFSVPGPPQGSPGDLTYHETAVRQMVAEFGSQVMSVNEGLAVILAELESTNFTGVGISIGGGMCNVCMAFLSVPVFSFSLPRAGDFIDSSAASVTGDLATQVRLVKEQSFRFNGTSGDKTMQALVVYYDEVIRAVVAALKDSLSRVGDLKRFDRPVPLVISGGSALPGGFHERFEKALQAQDLPVRFSEVRLAKDPLHATARGALIAALAEL